MILFYDFFFQKNFFKNLFFFEIYFFLFWIFISFFFLFPSWYYRIKNTKQAKTNILTFYLCQKLVFTFFRDLSSYSNLDSLSTGCRCGGILQFSVVVREIMNFCVFIFVGINLSFFDDF